MAAPRGLPPARPAAPLLDVVLPHAAQRLFDSKEVGAAPVHHLCYNSTTATASCIAPLPRATSLSSPPHLPSPPLRQVAREQSRRVLDGLRAAVDAPALLALAAAHLPTAPTNRVRRQMCLLLSGRPVCVC